MTSTDTAQAEAALKLPRIEGYLASDPGNLDLLALAIELAQTAGEFDRALRHADTALARYPGDAFFRGRMAGVLMAQHAWARAAAVLESLAQERADLNVAHNLAYCYTWLGRQREAFDLLTPFAAAAPLPSAAVALRLRALHHLGELDAAIALAEDQMARCQGDPAFLAAAAMLYFDAGQAAPAARLSELALAQGARPDAALVVAGSLALARTDTDTAISLFREVLSHNRSEGRSWAGLGLASLLKHEVPAAEQHLARALECMPEHVGTWHILGWCKIVRQDLDGARAVFSRTLDLDRNFADSHGGMAVVHALAGETAAADEAIRRALGLDAHCLSAKFARLILSGKIKDGAAFRELVGKMLSGYKGPFGQSLDILLAEQEKR